MAISLFRKNLLQARTARVYTLTACPLVTHGKNSKTEATGIDIHLSLLFRLNFSDYFFSKLGWNLFIVGKSNFKFSESTGHRSKFRGID